MKTPRCLARSEAAAIERSPGSAPGAAFKALGGPVLLGLLLGLWLTIAAGVVYGAPDTPAACRLASGATLANLNAALQAGCPEIETAKGATVMLQGPEGTEVTVPEGTKLTFQPDSLWKIEQGVLVRLLGSYAVPEQRRQFFSGPGRIVSDIGRFGMDTCKRPPSTVFPEWFGATPNDPRDDADAIARATDFGRDVRLDRGIYQLKQPVWLRGGQRLTGVDKAGTVLKQMPDFEVAKLSDSLLYKRPALDIKFNNFALGLDSDCAEASNLTIDGSAVTNESLAALTDSAEKRDRKEFYHPTYMHGVRVSTDHWMQQNWNQEKAAAARTPSVRAVLTLARPIRNVKLSNVSIKSPPISCIHLQSSVGVDGLLIDRVDCDAREAANSTGFNSEIFHADRKFANIYENVTIQDSAFRGGRYAVLRSAGIRNLKILRSTFDAAPTSTFVASFYTSDNAGPLTAQVFNSTFRHMNPLKPGSGPEGQKQALGVIEIAARGINNRADLPFMVVPAGGTSVKFYNSTFIAPKFGQVPQTIPLVVNHIGTSQPTEFHQSAFIGGTYGILADRRQSLVLVNDKGVNKMIPLTAEQATRYTADSVIVVDQCRFDGQAEAAIVAENTELHVKASTFQQIGTDRSRPQPMIQFGQPKSASTDTDSSFEGNTYAGEAATAFLAATSASRATRVKGNKPAGGPGSGARISTVLRSPLVDQWVIDDKAQ